MGAPAPCGCGAATPNSAAGGPRERRAPARARAPRREARARARARAGERASLRSLLAVCPRRAPSYPPPRRHPARACSGSRLRALFPVRHRPKPAGFRRTRRWRRRARGCVPARPREDPQIFARGFAEMKKSKGKSAREGASARGRARARPCARSPRALARSLRAGVARGGGGAGGRRGEGGADARRASRPVAPAPRSRSRSRAPRRAAPHRTAQTLPPRAQRSSPLPRRRPRRRGAAPPARPPRTPPPTHTPLACSAAIERRGRRGASPCDKPPPTPHPAPPLPPRLAPRARAVPRARALFPPGTRRATNAAAKKKKKKDQTAAMKSFLHGRACLTKHLWFNSFILSSSSPTGDSSRGVRFDVCVLVHLGCVCVIVEALAGGGARCSRAPSRPNRVRARVEPGTSRVTGSSLCVFRVGTPGLAGGVGAGLGCGSGCEAGIRPLRARLGVREPGD